MVIRMKPTLLTQIPDLRNGNNHDDVDRIFNRELSHEVGFHLIILKDHSQNYLWDYIGFN